MWHGTGQSGEIPPFLLIGVVLLVVGGGLFTYGQSAVEEEQAALENAVEIEVEILETDIETPLLVTAGENDWRCPPSQSEQLYVSVRKQGVDAKLVVYQNEHHNVGDPDRAIHRLETIDDWFARYDPEREVEDEEE